MMALLMLLEQAEEERTRQSTFVTPKKDRTARLTTNVGTRDRRLRVTGRWPFASGYLDADCMAGFCVMTEGSKPICNGAGAPLIKGFHAGARLVAAGLALGDFCHSQEKARDSAPTSK